MKVGQLAKQTGLTVRTLHYYEEVGLLVPARRTEAGHRLYGADEVVRLQKVMLLRQLGFSLEDIRAGLDQPGFSLAHAVALRLARLEEEMALQQQLHRRLETIAARLRTAEEISVETFIQTIKVMTMYEKYYTPEQLKQLEERGRTLGEERIRAAEAEWKDLIAKVRAEMEKGTDPASETMQRLAARWQGLIEEFTGGDPGIYQSLQTMYQQEGASQASQGMVEPGMMAYVAKAMQAGK